MPSTDLLGYAALSFLAITGPFLAVSATLLVIFGLLARMAQKTLSGMERMHFDPESSDYRSATTMLGWSSTIRTAGPTAIAGLAALTWFPGMLGYTIAAICALAVVHATLAYAPYRGKPIAQSQAPAVADGIHA